jgi:hypothetical protein
MANPADSQRCIQNHLSALGYTTAIHTDREVQTLNLQAMITMENLSSIPRIYQTLFHRTRKFATTVRDLVNITPQHWATAACLLVDWNVDVLRHPEIGIERFLISQRESLYWILDETLLEICVDQWDPPHSELPCQSAERGLNTSTTVPVPWDVATAPIRLALSKAQTLLPEWSANDLEEMRRWRAYQGNTTAEQFEKGWFRRSRKFLEESTRVYEIWRTVRLCGGRKLPAELANEIVEDVARFEGLPMDDLRRIYLPKEKKKT